ncbi:hypothetical protein ACFLUF_00125 [Chloroflexota bacterium]
MEKEEIRIEAPLAIAGVTLVPIVKVSLNYWYTKGRLSFFGTKQPVSLVVVSPQAKRAFRINGEEISLDQLTKEVPGIKEVLEGV